MLFCRRLERASCCCQNPWPDEPVQERTRCRVRQATRGSQDGYQIVGRGADQSSSILIRCAVDENVNTYLKSWKLPDNEFITKRRVTIPNLLSNTRGTTVSGFPGYSVTAPLPSIQQYGTQNDDAIHRRGLRTWIRSSENGGCGLLPTLWRK